LPNAAYVFIAALYKTNDFTFEKTHGCWLRDKIELASQQSSFEHADRRDRAASAPSGSVFCPGEFYASVASHAVFFPLQTEKNT
jgi:hypothetical protein